MDEAKVDDLGSDTAWPEVADLLSDALDLPPDARPRFLDKACGDDHSLRKRLEQLIAIDEDDDDDFLAIPLFSLHDGPQHSEDLADLDGVRIGHYRLVRPLGRGGMGTVHLAERVDGEFDHQVAVKLLKRGLDTDEILRRFRIERQVLARLIHPNIARLHDGGTAEDGRPYFVMEYVDGQPLDVYCEAGGFSVRQRVELFRSVCAAVSFAHRNLIVHRDLKPGNVLVAKADGDNPEESALGRVKLLDFGIAKLLGHDPEFHETQTLEAVPLTAHYASPEQVRGEPISTATDIYALGVLLYELLTGVRPHKIETVTPRHVEEVVCETVPPKPSTAASSRRLRRELSGDLDNIIMRALRKEPERRFASVGELSEDLQRYLEGQPVRSRRDTFAYRTDKFVRRNVRVLAAAAVIASLGIGVSAQAVRSQGREARLELLDTSLTRETRLKEAVTHFLVDFLKSADSSTTQGRTLSVREAFDAAVDRLEKADLDGTPEIKAMVADVIGGVYRDRGMYEEARLFLEQAVSLRVDTLGERNPQVAESLHNLASLEHGLGRLEQAEKLMRQAIAIQRDAYQDDHRDLARGLNNLAALIRQLNRLDDAESFAREGLAMKIRLFGVDNPEVATSLNTLARIRRQQGDPAEAETLYRRAIQIRSGHPPNREGAKLLNSLSDLLQNMGHLDEALDLSHEALRLRRQLFPEGHRDVIASLNNFGYLKMSMGDYQGARAIYVEAVAMSESLPNQPHLALLQENLSLVLSRMDEDIR